MLAKSNILTLVFRIIDVLRPCYRSCYRKREPRVERLPTTKVVLTFYLGVLKPMAFSINSHKLNFKFKFTQCFLDILRCSFDPFVFKSVSSPRCTLYKLFFLKQARRFINKNDFLLFFQVVLLKPTTACFKIDDM